MNLELAVILKEIASKELLEAIREDAKIADNMRDVWANQNAGSEGQ